MINQEIDYAKLERVRDEMRYPDWNKVEASPNTYFGLLRDQMLAVQAYAEELDQRARLEHEQEYQRLLVYGMVRGFIEDAQSYS